MQLELENALLKIYAYINRRSNQVADPTHVTAASDEDRGVSPLTSYQLQKFRVRNYRDKKPSSTVTILTEMLHAIKIRDDKFDFLLAMQLKMLEQQMKVIENHSQTDVQ